MLRAAWCVALLSLSASLAQAQWIPPNGRDVQAGVGHFESRGVGFDRGFTSFEAFMPTFDSLGERAAFLDYRFSVTNVGDQWHNAGIGYRQLVPGVNTIVGAYVYYDARGIDEERFHQVSNGVELLGDWFDARVNGYYPVGTDRKFTGQTYFAGNQILGTIDAALTGADAEIGTRVPGVENLKLFGGGYTYHVMGSPDATGPRGRLEWYAAPWLTGEVAVQHDDLYGTTVTGGIVLRFGRTACRAARPTQLSDRLGQSVRRNYNIVMDRQVEALVNPVTALPWTVTHFDNQQPAGGDGTFERPFNTLGGAPTSDIVFVYQSPNDYLTTGIDLADDQRLFGQELVYPLSSATWGDFTLPGYQSGDAPVIRATGALDVVRLANDNEVAGLTIVGGTSGIRGVGIRDVSIHDVEINSALRGVDLSLVGGSLQFQRVGLDANGTGLRVNASNVALTFSDSTASDNLNDGILISASTGTYQFDGSTFADNGNFGLCTLASSGTYTLSGLSATGNAAGGLAFHGNVNQSSTVTLSSSTFSANGYDLFFTGRGQYDFTATSNSFSGGNALEPAQNSDIAIAAILGSQADFVADINNNTFENLNQYAVHISQEAGAANWFADVDISENTFTNIDLTGFGLPNRGDAVHLESTGTGSAVYSVDDNLFENVANRGLFLGTSGPTATTLFANSNRFDTINQNAIELDIGAGSLVTAAGEGNQVLNVSGSNIVVNGILSGSITFLPIGFDDP